MAINENTGKSYRIYIKADRVWAEVSEEIYREYTRANDTFRHRMQAHGRCECPKNKFWVCDTDCCNCEYQKAGDKISLDFESENADGDTYSLLDTLPDNSPLVEDVIAGRLLLQQLIQHLYELDPEGKRIISMLESDFSDRAIAEALNRPQRSFARFMKRYRDDCRRMRDE